MLGGRRLANNNGTELPPCFCQAPVIGVCGIKCPQRFDNGQIEVIIQFLRCSSVYVTFDASVILTASTIQISPSQSSVNQTDLGGYQQTRCDRLSVAQCLARLSDKATDAGTGGFRQLSRSVGSSSPIFLEERRKV